MPQFPIHRCLLFSLEVGKVAIVRQVIPSVHIEYDRAFCEKLKPHVRKIVWVEGGAVEKNTPLESIANENYVAKASHSATTASASDSGSHNEAVNGFTTIAFLGDILKL